MTAFAARRARNPIFTYPSEHSDACLPIPDGESLQRDHLVGSPGQQLFINSICMRVNAHLLGADGSLAVGGASIKNVTVARVGPRAAQRLTLQRRKWTGLQRNY